MTKGRVDVLEAIEIEEDHGQPLPPCICCDDRVSETFGDQSPVWESRQWVVRSEKADSFLGLIAIGDIEAGADNVFDVALGVHEDRVEPGDLTPTSVLRRPASLIVVGASLRGETLEGSALTSSFFRTRHDVPYLPISYFTQFEARRAHAALIEADDPTGGVENQHERRRVVDDGRHDVTLAPQVA